MFELAIESSSENYKVVIGVASGDVAAGFDFAIVDANVASVANVKVPTFLVTAIEPNKTLGQVEEICSAMAEAGVTRNSRVLAIGGGIIQDLATLASSLYMRGVRWSYIPTTLTGMADSCLGGKSSINVGSRKNLVGNIHPPENIFIDTSFLETLPTPDLVSGLSEAVKICFAKGPEAFEAYLANSSIFEPSNSTAMQELIHLSLSSKKWFIEKDEFDRAERQLLNFGHSFGHALEAATHFAVPHGVGVALGMIAASEHPSTVKSESVDRLIAYCRQILESQKDLIQKADAQADWQQFEVSLRSDKKNTKDSLCLVLPSAGNELAKVFLPFSEGAVETARAVMQKTIQELI